MDVCACVSEQSGICLKKKKKIKPESCFPTKQLLSHCWIKTNSSFLSAEQTVEHFFFLSNTFQFFHDSRDRLLVEAQRI